MWELDYKESWPLKNWCFWTVMLEDSWESLDCKESQPVHPKGHGSWIFIGRTDGEAETPILWLPDVKNWLIWKDPDAGKDWRWQEKVTAECEMVGWHLQLNGHEFEYASGVGDGQGSLACCSPWGCKESDMPELLSWTELNWTEICTQRECHVYMKSEIMVICLYGTVSRKSPEARRDARYRFFFRVIRRNQPCWHLNLGHLSSKTVTQSISVV